MVSSGSRAVFLDRDGTLNEDVHYLKDFGDFRMLPGVDEGLRLLSEAGYRLFVVSNQSGVARGYFTLAEAQALNARIDAFFRARGVAIEEFAICPHHPEGANPEFARDCDCRKPRPGLILRLAEKYGLDPGASFTVGDRERDAEAGMRAGTRGILLGKGPFNYLGNAFRPETYPSLLEFARKVAGKA